MILMCPVQGPWASSFDIACAPIIETRLLELAMSLLDFSPWIPLSTFLILLRYALLCIETRLISNVLDG